MTEINEIWRPIKGFEGLYEVSNLGNVKRIIGKKERILKQSPNNQGYLMVCLSKDGIHKTLFIHRLVAQAFIPNPKNLETVNHIDEDKTNNRVDNLEWMNRGENSRYSNKIGVNQYTLDGEFIKTWECIREIEYQLGFKHGNISKCCKGKPHYNSAYGYIWKYA